MLSWSKIIVFYSTYPNIDAEMLKIVYKNE